MQTLGTVRSVATRSAGFALMLVVCGIAETCVRLYESAVTWVPWLDEPL
jgi:hypothetical protein